MSAIAQQFAPCTVCGVEVDFRHDHKPDQSGVDDGVAWLPGQQPRKKPAPKPAKVMTELRARAWATRRDKYGEHGHG